MKIIENIESTIDIRFRLWEVSRLARMLEETSKAKVEEDMFKKFKKILELFETN